ncbi:MAG: histidine kinase [Acidithiobacillus ferrivorans]|uniref:Histidine kinase n=1 Tax=Acidithiobacillus ferrivorans TaxID=160808 RepID=A0A257T0L3_9PROT|nr:MAG: histidine kinase [Acidithiobacillus ferrivorans]
MNQPFATSGEIFVRTVGMDSRKEAVFRMAFKMYTRRSYRLLEAQESRDPTLAIIDVDGPEGMNLAHRFRQEHPQLRILITSITPDATSGFPALQKPVRMETLFPALEALLQGGAQESAPAAAPTPPVAGQGKTTTATVTPIRPELSGRTAAIPEAPAVTSPPAQPAAAPHPAAPILRPEDVRHFDPEQGLLGLLLMVRRDQVPTVIVEGAQRIILKIDPIADQVLSLVDDETLKTLAQNPAQRLQARAPSSADIPANTPVRHLTLQALLWQVGAWTANGRLINRLQPNTPVQLKHWPNLTRLSMLPEALRLAAFLARSPASPVLVVKMLRVAPADLFNFLAASESLGLLRYNPIGSTEAKAVTPPAEPAKQEIPTARRGLLGRLLARIAGL